MKNKSGLILTEALVAIAMLVISTIVMSSIIQNSLSTTTMSKDYMIAQNLATESIEVVKVIRDSNLLIRPAELNPGQDCWLVLDPASLLLPINNCNMTAVNGQNYLTEQIDGKWKLKSVIGEDLNLASINQARQRNYQLFLKNNRYIHSVAAGLKETKFYRRVKFTIPADKSSATVEVKVQWKTGQKIRTVVRSYTLFNQTQ